LGESTTRQKGVPYLDVSATYKDGEVILCVINRNKEAAVTTDILSQTGVFSGDLQVTEVNGPDIHSANDFGKETVTSSNKSALHPNGNTVTYSFPPHSFTLIKGHITK
jgi:alpha-N-arabinofuranosidase